MQRLAVALSLIGLTLAVTPACAGPITTLTFGGTLYSAYDGGGLFGPPNTSYPGGMSYTATIAYDPTTFGACNNAPHGCTWTLSAANGLVETFTLNSHTVTFQVTSGTLQFQTGGGSSNQITLNTAGTGFSFNSQFGDTNLFFGSPANLSPALAFNSVALSYGSGNANTSVNTSFGFAITTLSAATATPAVTTAEVPEPATLAILGAALALLALRRRRWARGGWSPGPA